VPSDPLEQIQSFGSSLVDYPRVGRRELSRAARMNTPTPPSCLSIEINDVTRSMMRLDLRSFDGVILGRKVLRNGGVITPSAIRPTADITIRGGA